MWRMKITAAAARAGSGLCRAALSHSLSAGLNRYSKIRNQAKQREGEKHTVTGRIHSQKLYQRKFRCHSSWQELLKQNLTRWIFPSSAQKNQLPFELSWRALKIATFLNFFSLPFNLSRSVSTRVNKRRQAAASGAQTCKSRREEAFELLDNISIMHQRRQLPKRVIIFSMGHYQGILPMRGALGFLSGYLRWFQILGFCASG